MSTPSTRRTPNAYLGATNATPRGVAGGQHVADPSTDEVVVFLIGMRINRWRRIRTWWPVFTAMPRMLRELADRDLGLLDVRTYWSGRDFLTVQYWRTAEELGAYARNKDLAHAPAWATFNKRAAATGHVGVWHETYLVSKHRIESLYGNMPLHGLAAAHGWIERGAAGQRSDALRRLGTTTSEYSDE